MKKKLLIATATTAGLVTYLLYRKYAAGCSNPESVQNKVEHREHHLTDVFSKAKMQLVKETT